MKKLFLIKACMVCSISAFAQDAISSSGDYDVAGSVAVSWTLGEISTETYSGGNTQLTQGLHQTEIVITATDPASENELVRIFPNPATLKVTIENKDQRFNSWKMIDQKGVSVMSGSLGEKADLLVDGLTAGSYILLLNEKEGDAAYHFNLIIN